MTTPAETPEQGYSEDDIHEIFFMKDSEGCIACVWAAEDNDPDPADYDLLRDARVVRLFIGMRGPAPTQRVDVAIPDEPPRDTVVAFKG